jgi:hypothetical protein
MLISLFLGMMMSAEAEQVFSLEPMKQELNSGNIDKALKIWKTERQKLSCPQRIPDTKTLAQLWVYQGYAYYLQNDSVSNQEAWRKAFVIDSDVQFDMALLEGKPEDDVDNVLNFFEQNRRLTTGSQTVIAQVPEKLGEAQLFIDGENVLFGTEVFTGAHLFQINCPQDSLQSKWMILNGEVSEKVDWLGLCPSGVDTSVEVETDDMFASMGFGSSIDTTKIVNEDSVCHKDPTLDGSSFSMPSFSLPEGLITKERMVIASGGLLLSSGVASYYLWTIPKFSSVEEARLLGTISEDKAANISKEFNQARWATLGLLGAGLGVTGYGTLLQIQSTGTGIIISGQF